MGNILPNPFKSSSTTVDKTSEQVEETPTGQQVETPAGQLVRSPAGQLVRPQPVTGGKKRKSSRKHKPSRVSRKNRRKSNKI